jgi:hypothetical protein
MAQAGEGIARYHKLLDQEKYRDLAWAEELQDQMRRQKLTESGRLLAPVLRPCFLSRQQFETLARATEHIASIIDLIEALALESPPLLRRLHLLPAERMLAAVPPGCLRSSVTTRMDAYVQNGSVSLQGFDACKPAGFVYSDALADLFLKLPIVREFRNGCRVAKIGGSKPLVDAIFKAWREFGGQNVPRAAVVEFTQQFGSDSTESHLFAEVLARGGIPAQVVSPDRLEYSRGRLRAGDFEIDVVIRRLLTQELLARSDLSHPLLLAYRDHAVCVINNFRSEMAQRRDLFELVTDEQVTAQLPFADRALIRQFVPWTRVVAQKKTRYKDREVDLPEFIRREREHLLLRPNEHGGDLRTFIGGETSASEWDQALRGALRRPYVVQEQVPRGREKFPFFRYGDLQIRETEVAIHPHVFHGSLQGASATLGAGAVAPVLLVDSD